MSLVPDSDFDPAEYPQDGQRAWAELLEEAKSAGGVVFDASDLMPAEIGYVTSSSTEGYELGSFYRLMVDLGDDRSYYEDPELLMARLEEIDAAWAELRATGEF